MTGRHTAGLAIRVDGRRLPAACDVALAWAAVEENGRTSARAELGFRDPRGASLLTETGIGLGARITLTAFAPDGAHDLFEGEVTGCESRATADVAPDEASGSGVLTVIRAEDQGHRLRRGHRTLAYHEMSADQIVDEVAKLAGVRVGTLDSTPVVYSFLTQPAMSDWDFLSHLARENGRDLFFRDGALHFREPARAADAPAKGTAARQSPFALRFGENLVKVSSAASLDDQVTAVEVRGWDPVRKEPLFTRETPGPAVTRDVGWENGSDVVRGEPLLLAGLPRTTQHEVENIAAAMAREVSAGLTRLRAVVRGEPRLRLRSAVCLTGLGPRFEGRYTVSSVRHEYHPESGYLTELAVDEGADRAAVGRPGDGEDGLRRFHGLLPGTVLNIKDDRQAGRVKVRLPWLSPEYESNWARTVQLGGSRGHGVVLPEVGDEVLVGFEHGVLDRPYVLGGLYNGVDAIEDHGLALVDDSKGSANRRSFASKEGHRLELLDAGGRGMGATLITGDGKLQIRLDQHETLVSVRSDGTVEITAEKGVTVDAGRGLLELKGRKVTVDATEGVSLSAPAVDLSADTRMTVSGATVKVSGSGLAELSAPLVKIN
ncbi:VgrG-related protein [Streptomyces lavendulae]|uniref:VgrG-related protein n=1 Tax=Streptomyces lavendulae TaxID=1914 RepID=UPI00381DA871